MTAAKREHVAHVDKDTSLFFDRFLKSFGPKGWNAWKISKNFRPFRVHFFHDRIVMRDRGRGFNRIIGEAFRISELQEFIEFALVTDRAAQPRTDIGPAW